MVQEIQYHLLENPSGVAGTGMSGQTTITAIINAIQYARDKFVLDADLPFSYHSVFGSPPPPNGMINELQNTAYVHRASWQDTFSGVWTSLWTEDAWSTDKADPLWPVKPGMPRTFSESENAPLKLQLSPPPLNTGTLEVFSVDTLATALTTANQTFQVPDEWVHAIKYGAMSRLFSTENQLKDPLRAEYCNQRYQQAMEFAKDARSIIRLVCNGTPLPIDSVTSLDAAQHTWRNQTGRPRVAGVLYDVVVVSPGVSDKIYGMAADVVQSAPLPTSTDPIQMGQEDLEYITKYALHYLSFKCGGNEFKSSMSEYDTYLTGISIQKGVNKAKIRYLTPLLGQAQQEWAMQPDRVGV